MWVTGVQTCALPICGKHVPPCFCSRSLLTCISAQCFLNSAFVRLFGFLLLDLKAETEVQTNRAFLPCLFFELFRVAGTPHPCWSCLFCPSEKPWIFPLLSSVSFGICVQSLLRDPSATYLYLPRVRYKRHGELVTVFLFTFRKRICNLWRKRHFFQDNFILFVKFTDRKSVV